jgi:hypothetical protein
MIPKTSLVTNDAITTTNVYICHGPFVMIYKVDVVSEWPEKVLIMNTLGGR